MRTPDHIELRRTESQEHCAATRNVTLYALRSHSFFAERSIALHVFRIVRSHDAVARQAREDIAQEIVARPPIFN